MTRRCGGDQCVVGFFNNSSLSLLMFLLLMLALLLTIIKPTDGELISFVEKAKKMSESQKPSSPQQQFQQQPQQPQPLSFNPPQRKHEKMKEPVEEPIIVKAPGLDEVTVSFGDTQVHFGNITDTEYFPQPINQERIRQRKRQQYPFISLDYFIGKANTFLDRTYLSADMVHQILHKIPMEGKGEKPIVFIPSEYLLHYAIHLIQMNQTFSLITVSNQPMCVPYFKFPQFCEEEETKIACYAMDLLLQNPYLEKWYTKNPCIIHPKIVPIPIGVKWQWVSRTFYTENTRYMKSILDRMALKPYALFKNYSSLLYETTDSDRDGIVIANQRDLNNAISRSKSSITSMSMSMGSTTQQHGMKSNTHNKDTSSSHNRHNAMNLHGNMEEMDFDTLFQLKKKMIFTEYEETDAMMTIANQVFPQKDKLLYFNFDIETTDIPMFADHQYIRRYIYESLQQNGFEESPVNRYASYLQTLSEYKFCVSPPGVGLDTHRTWEALMVGTIPIVLSSPLNSLYDELPVLVVDSFDSLNEDVLNQIYEMFHHPNSAYSFEKLYMDYWDKLIV